MDDRDIETIVFEALGAASTCWIPSTGDAVFDSTRARAIGEELLIEVRRRIADEQGRLRAGINDLRAALFGAEPVAAETVKRALDVLAEVAR